MAIESDSLVRPRIGETRVTAQGHPYAIFRRAIEKKNLLVAETTARELGTIGLSDAFDLVCLVAEKDGRRLDAYARRWLCRLLVARPLRIVEIDLVVTALRAMPSERATAAIRALIEP